MAEIKDVNVIITRETQALTQQGFGMPMILATNVDKAYKEYLDLPGVAEDYIETTEAYKMANKIFGQTPRPEKIAIYGVVYDDQVDQPSDLVAALNDLVDTRNDWYVLLCDQQGDAEITALSGWVDAQKKLYFTSTDNLALAASLESDRTIIMYHDNPTTYPECGWVGRCLPELPGSITWKFKTINGILPVDIGVTDLTDLHTNGGNTYLTKLGINQASEGLVTSGEYIDIMQAQDFIEARMTENVSRLLMTAPKVPFDNTGIAMVVAEVEKTLKQAAGQGIVAKDDDGNYQYTIAFKKRSEIPSNEIASRKLTGITWTVVVAGAVHTVEIRGTLTITEL